MKLLSMYVDNFGKLSGFTYNFESSMNTIYEENGWRKSTFAAFIKAMLYYMVLIEIVELNIPHGLIWHHLVVH